MRKSEMRDEDNNNQDENNGYVDNDDNNNETTTISPTKTISDENGNDINPGECSRFSLKHLSG